MDIHGYTRIYVDVHDLTRRYMTDNSFFHLIESGSNEIWKKNRQFGSEKIEIIRKLLFG